jgi:hypothetical protein
MKIKNKIISLFASIAIMSFAVQTNVLAQAKNFAGPSLAINGSYNGGNVRMSEGGDTLFFGQESSVLGVDAAYTFPVDNNFFIALGATYDLGKTKAGGTTGSVSATAELDEHKSIYLQPGYTFNNSTALFAKLGYHEADGKLNVTVGNASGTLSGTFNGWSYGLGLKSFFNNNAFVQVEGNVTEYESKTALGVSFEPTVVSATISVGYKF